MFNIFKDAKNVLFSFEFLFVLFLYAGKFKNDSAFSWVPVDLTVLFLLLSVVTSVWVIYKRGGTFRRPPLYIAGLFGAFVSYVSVSYLWTPSDAYALQKVGYISVLTYWPLLSCAIIIGYRRERLKRFAIALTALSIWFCIEAVTTFLSSTIVGQQIEALGITYLGLGRVIGPASLILFTYGTVVGRRGVLRLMALLMFGGSIAVLLLLGGRGPFLATIIPAALLFYYGLNLNFRRGTIRIRRYMWPLIVLVSAAVALAVTFGASETMSTIKRLYKLTESLGESARIRIQMYGEALQIWMAHPIFGAGVGSWPVLAGYGDIKMYPHNMILEVVSEFGLTGFFLFSLPFLFAFRHLRRTTHLRYDPWALLALMLFLNAFINAMFTGDLSDNRYVFAFLGFLVARHEGAGTRLAHASLSRNPAFS